MLAIIPARGGSKGLPGKNIKLLLGKPLIAYTIEAALNANSVTSVIVSTDDHEIAAVSKRYGATIPFLRPPELATDESLAIDTYLYVIERLEREVGIPIPEVMVLLPTCPLRLSADIDAATELFFSKKADSVVSYVEEQHPVFWHREIGHDQRLINFWDNDYLQNRQALKKTYYPNGAIYIFRKDILQKRQYYTENSFGYIMPRNRSIDIDSIEDFELAEFYLNHHYAS